MNLENIKHSTHQLHLISLRLTSSEVMAFAQAISEGTAEKENALCSVSFSYNLLLGDSAAATTYGSSPKYVFCV